VVSGMTKIIWGINIPYQSTKIDWEATDKMCKNTPYAPTGFNPIRVPCIRIHKEMSFELCDVCGSQVPSGRVKRGITTCSPAHNAKKWDAINGLVIEKERNACGVRPTSFWQTISYECFKRDNFTCKKCHKNREELENNRKMEQMINGKYNTHYKPTDYILNCHHIKAIKDGGNNKLENLETLCGKCHKIEHSRAKNESKKYRTLENFI